MPPWVHVEVMGSVQALLGTGGDVVVARGRSGAVGEAVGVEHTKPDSEKKHSYKIDASTSTTKLHSLELFNKQKIVFFFARARTRKR